jgi:16S rRNA (cytosine967-C5)-methyltransferase
LGAGIDKELFTVSFLSQPDLFLRIRPGKMGKVISRLTGAGIEFETVNDHCLRFANATALDKIIQLNEDAVIQDYNSQQVLNFLEKNTGYFPVTTTTGAWDCCAASGGKSILLYDVLKGNITLTVSDIRENILFNLVKRLQQAGVKIQDRFIADLSKADSLPGKKAFPLVICDVPCTGSGTWSRTPEQLVYFNEDSIDRYAERQKKIVSNIIPHLATGGLLFYITCSVFKKENEELVELLQRDHGMELKKKELLTGYDKNADSMFAALLCNTNSTPARPNV